MPDLADLIARLEAATEGSRELDAEIYVRRVADIPDGAEIYLERPGTVGWSVPRDQTLRMSAHDVPHFTTSLDAAMTLVPEWALWDLDHKLNLGPAEDGYATPAGEPKTIYRAGCGVQLPNEKMSSWFRHQHFTEPALAVCIVALRARAAGSTVHEYGPAPYFHWKHAPLIPGEGKDG